MQTGVLVLIGGSFHIRHICRKEGRVKIEGIRLTIAQFGIMKEEVTSRTSHAMVEACARVA